MEDRGAKEKYDNVGIDREFAKTHWMKKMFTIVHRIISIHNNDFNANTKLIFSDRHKIVTVRRLILRSPTSE